MSGYTREPGSPWRAGLAALVVMVVIVIAMLPLGVLEPIAETISGWLMGWL